MDETSPTEIFLCITIFVSAFCAKAPQMIQILENKSATGISVASIILDIVSLTILTSYLHGTKPSFRECADPFASALATSVLCCEVLYFKNYIIASVVLIISYVSSNFILLSGITSIEIITMLMCIMIPVNLGVKLRQAYINYQNGNTGQISGVTTTMSFCGGIIKTLSAYQSSEDPILVANAMVTVIGSGVIGAQILYYKHREPQVTEPQVTQPQICETPVQNPL